MKNTKKKSSGVSIYQVSELAGVAPCTVSRVLNNRGNVNQDTRKKVFKAMRQLNFTSKKRIPRIGFLVSGLEDMTLTTYITRIVINLSKSMANRNCLLNMLTENELDQPFEAEYDCLISAMFGREIIRYTEIPNLPLIALNRYVDHPNIHQYFSNHVQSVEIAIEHLLEMGHKKIALLIRNKSAWGASERTKGYRNMLIKNDIKEEFIGCTQEEPLMTLVARLRKQNYTSIINFADNAYLELPHLLHHVLGLQIPEDISIISANLPSISDLQIPPMTAVDQPLEQMINDLVNDLDSILTADNSEIICKEYNNTLIKRDSVLRI